MGTHWNLLAEAVLMSTLSLCFVSKKGKICIPLYTPVLLHKVWFKGIFTTRTCYPAACTSVRSTSCFTLSEKFLYHMLPSPRDDIIKIKNRCNMDCRMSHYFAVQCSNCTADQRLCFRYIPVLLKSKISSF